MPAVRLNSYRMWRAWLSQSIAPISGERHTQLKNTVPSFFNFFCDGSEGCVLINADHMRLPVPMWSSMLLVLVSNFESGDSTDHASCRTHVATVHIITIRPGCTFNKCSSPNKDSIRPRELASTVVANQIVVPARPLWGCYVQ